MCIVLIYTKSNFIRMQRIWVKKEHMYYKPFYKHKLKVTLLLVILMAVVFFAYQIFCMNQLNIVSFEDGGGSGHHRVHSNYTGHYNRFQRVAEAKNK